MNCFDQSHNTGTSWSGLISFDCSTEILPNIPVIQGLLNEFNVRILTNSGENQSLQDGAGVLEGGSRRNHYSACTNEVWRVTA